MTNNFTEQFSDNIDFIYTSFNRVIMRGYILGLFVVIAIVKSLENCRTFANKTITTKSGKKHLQMYACNKFASQYYIYIQDKELGLCYLKISSYLPFSCEFYFNGHNYLKQQFDLQGKRYTMKDNSFTKVGDLELLNILVSEFQPSIALERIGYWMNLFFRFDKGSKSTRSKLLTHNWYTGQIEISANIIFKSPQFASSLFQCLLNKHHTIGLPDKLTEIFSLQHYVNPLLSKQIKDNQKKVSTNPSVLEQAYSDIDKQRYLILKELVMAA